MAKSPRGKTQVAGHTAANLAFAAKLWVTADALRNNMDVAEYKHVVLDFVFLKYISDAFEAKHAELASQTGEGADPEHPDEYYGASIFWVPKDARWSQLKEGAPQPTIGTLVGDAMTAIERDHDLVPPGLARFVLANGSISSGESGEDEIGAEARHERLAHA